MKRKIKPYPTPDKGIISQDVYKKIKNLENEAMLRKYSAIIFLNPYAKIDKIKFFDRIKCFFGFHSKTPLAGFTCLLDMRYYCKVCGKKFMKYESDKGSKFVETNWS